MPASAPPALSGPEPLLTPPFDDLSPLPRARVAAMHAAGRELIDLLEILVEQGRHPVRDVLDADPKAFTHWAPQPSTAVQDTTNGGAWYYHSHEAGEHAPWEEHGHFHCFHTRDLIRRRARSLARPPEERAGGYVHLAALSIDVRGVPIKLFSVNRWMTDEWLYRAADITPLVDRFSAIAAGQFVETSRWLAAMLRLFQPQVAWLLAERERVILGAHHSEDRSIGVTSAVDLDLDRQLDIVECAWRCTRD
jgi:hypothetical protein